MTMDAVEPAKGEAAFAAPPQYSADGHWWWEGTQWVPAATVQPAPVPAAALGVTASPPKGSFSAMAWTAPQPVGPAATHRDLTASSLRFSSGSLLMLVAGVTGVVAALWLRWVTVSLSLSSTGTVDPPLVTSASLRRLTFGHVGIAIAFSALIIALIGVWLDYHGKHVPQLSALADGVVGLVVLTWTVHAWTAFAGDKHNTMSIGTFSTTLNTKVTMGPAPYVFLLVGVLAFVAAWLEWKRAKTPVNS